MQRKQNMNHLHPLEGTLSPFHDPFLATGFPFSVPPVHNSPVAVTALQHPWVPPCVILCREQVLLAALVSESLCHTPILTSFFLQLGH